jgi:hypothetical protein
MSNSNASFSTLPPLPSHLPDSLSRAEWLSLVRADQHRRWRRGERVLVEDYLTRWPTLAEDVKGLLDLVYGEVLLREESGESVTVDEYVRRFPTHEASLKRQFDLHRALAAGSLLEAATSDNGTSPPTRPPSDWTSQSHAGRQVQRISHRRQDAGRVVRPAHGWGVRLSCNRREGSARGKPGRALSAL